MKKIIYIIILIFPFLMPFKVDASSLPSSNLTSVFKYTYWDNNGNLENSTNGLNVGQVAGVNPYYWKLNRINIYKTNFALKSSRTYTFYIYLDLLNIPNVDYPYLIDMQCPSDLYSASNVYTWNGSNISSADLEKNDVSCELIQTDTRNALKFTFQLFVKNNVNGFVFDLYSNNQAIGLFSNITVGSYFSDTTRAVYTDTTKIDYSYTEGLDSQGIINSQQETTNSVNNLNDTIKDTSPPNNTSALSNSAGWLPPGPIDSILNLPLSLFNNLTDNLSKSCQPIHLIIPFVNTDFELPCVNTLYSQIGNLSSYINVIGVIASAFLLFYYLLNLYHWVDNTLSFRENNMPGDYEDRWGGGY